jgi:glucosylceramidase
LRTIAGATLARGIFTIIEIRRTRTMIKALLIALAAWLAARWYYRRTAGTATENETPPQAVPVKNEPKAKTRELPNLPEPADVFALPVSTVNGPSITVTSAEGKRFAAAAAVPWRATAKRTGYTSPRETITVDPQQKFQTIVGFGGAFTDAACFMFSQMPASARATLFGELFHPTQLGLNVHRACIGSSDYATKMYSYDEGEPDPELKRFSIEHDRQWNLPMMREAFAVNPDIFLFASAWSPPGWMKSNGSMLGGNMRRSSMDVYAQYMVRFVQDYAAEGIPVHAVTVNNEVDTDQDGRMPACLWPQEYEVDFVRYHLGPAFEAARIKTDIWLIDHNYNLYGRAIASFEEPGLLKYCHAVAWHGYVGPATNIGRVKAAFPQVDMYWTEGGPDVTDPNYARDWAKWGRTFTTNLRNWCRSITVWNLALDENGHPNIGPFPCGGLVTINSQSKEVSYSGQFWALGQFSKFVKRGAYRIESSGNFDGLDHVAFTNPDGSHVLVITNSGATARDITVSVGGNLADVRLDADSVTTLTW